MEELYTFNNYYMVMIFLSINWRYALSNIFYFLFIKPKDFASLEVFKLTSNFFHHSSKKGGKKAFVFMSHISFLEEKDNFLNT